jgi:hypothetical protein
VNVGLVPNGMNPAVALIAIAWASEHAIIAVKSAIRLPTLMVAFTEACMTAFSEGTGPRRIFD